VDAVHPMARVSSAVISRLSVYSAEMAMLESIYGVSSQDLGIAPGQGRAPRSFWAGFVLGWATSVFAVGAVFTLAVVLVVANLVLGQGGVERAAEQMVQQHVAPPGAAMFGFPIFATPLLHATYVSVWWRRDGWMASCLACSAFMAVPICFLGGIARGSMVVGLLGGMMLYFPVVLVALPFAMLPGYLAYRLHRHNWRSFLESA